ncbi:MAG TPA: nitroreductase family deazaflavin-dependent oxidoreductase [Acidimicrobiales bacterium]|jgi:deazaflavin-dependent oxidoreductase (nitroreductase family)|nr:nitroreductase family deazaflavin-dependent oxidoreductase [Acidimicrobiales bacterium]
MNDTASSYNKPDWFTQNVMNPAVAGLTRIGLPVLGSRVVEVTGRKSGLPRRTPVNLLEVDGQGYLVAPRGETEWVRNARADGNRVVLIKGRRRSAHVLVEVEGVDKTALLRAYLKRWKFEVGMFFNGVGPESTDEELAAEAVRHPVFRLQSASA